MELSLAGLHPASRRRDHLSRGLLAGPCLRHLSRGTYGLYGSPFGFPRRRLRERFTDTVPCTHQVEFPDGVPFRKSGAAPFGVGGIVLDLVAPLGFEPSSVAREATILCQIDDGAIGRRHVVSECLGTSSLVGSSGDPSLLQWTHSFLFIDESQQELDIGLGIRYEISILIPDDADRTVVSISATLDDVEISELTPDRCPIHIPQRPPPSVPGRKVGVPLSLGRLLESIPDLPQSLLDTHQDSPSPRMFGQTPIVGNISNMGYFTKRSHTLASQIRSHYCARGLFCAIAQNGFLIQYWWGGRDSNPQCRRRRIYSPLSDQLLNLPMMCASHPFGCFRTTRTSPGPVS